MPWLSENGRLTIAWVLAALGALALLLMWLRLKTPGHRFAAWLATGVAALAVLVLWYNNSALYVFPSSAHLKEGEALPMTATPHTMRERIIGRRTVTWVSSNTTFVTLDTTGDRVIAYARKRGQATLYAIRGNARSQARVTVMDASGHTSPPCGGATTASVAVDARTAARSAGASLDSARALANPLRRSLVCIAGSVTSPSGQPLPGVELTLDVLGPRRDTIWTQYATTDPVDGRYEFLILRDSIHSGHSALDTLSFRIFIDHQVVENRHVWFMPTQWGLDTASRVVPGRLLRDSLYRDIDIPLRYSTHSAFFILWLLLPAIFGLLSTVLYKHYYGPAADEQLKQSEEHRDERKRAERTVKRARFLTLFYVFGNALMWGTMLAVFAVMYAFRSIQTISLFHPRITIPVLAPTFAFLGVLVWATYVLSRRETRRRSRAGETDEEAEARRQLRLLAIGNRIIVAPYLAIVIVLFLNSDDTYDRQIPFLAFFTGLWIEPVLKLIKEIGQRLTVRLGTEREGAARTQQRAPNIFDNAQQVVDQKREELQKRQDVKVRDVLVSARSANGAGTIPVALVFVEPTASREDLAKLIPHSLSGSLHDGRTFTVPTELVLVQP